MGPRIAAVLAAAALLWLAAAPARAAATVFLDELTWTELRDAVKAGVDLAAWVRAGQLLFFLAQKIGEFSISSCFL